MARLTSSGALQETAAQQSRRLLPKKVMCKWRKASLVGVSGTVKILLISAVSYHWFTIRFSCSATSGHLLMQISPESSPCDPAIARWREYTSVRKVLSIKRREREEIHCQENGRFISLNANFSIHRLIQLTNGTTFL